MVVLHNFPTHFLAKPVGQSGGFSGGIMGDQFWATPVDFAYAVHTGLGNTCVACKSNGDLIPLSTRLESGAKLQIITTKDA